MEYLLSIFYHSFLSLIEISSFVCRYSVA